MDKLGLLAQIFKSKRVVEAVDEVDLGKMPVDEINSKVKKVKEELPVEVDIVSDPITGNAKAIITETSLVDNEE